MTRHHSREPYPAEKARQGRIVLRGRARRLLFIGGLLGLLMAAIAVPIALAA